VTRRKLGGALRESGSRWGWWIFEAGLVDVHHAFVGFVFAVDEGLFVDVGPAEAEAEALDGVVGFGGGLGEAVGLRGGHGPGKQGTAGRWPGEALLHGGDGVAAAVDAFAAVGEELVVVREAAVHACLLDGQERDEGTLLGGSPDGLGGSEVAQLGGADGARQAGRGGEQEVDFAFSGDGGIGGLGGLLEPGFEAAHVEVAGDDYAVVDGLGAEVGFKGDALVAVVEGFDGLFESNGDDEADDDGGDVEEEVAPGVGGVVGRVDVEHGLHSWAEWG